MSNKPSSAMVWVSEVACYLGFAPLAVVIRRHSKEPLSARHTARAMAWFFVLFVLFVLVCMVDVIECLLVINFPVWSERLAERLAPLLACLGYGLYGLGAFVVFVWLFLLLETALGGSLKIPVLDRLAQAKRIIRFSFVLNSLVLCLIPPVVGVALHATSLTRRSTDRAAVYFLYDEGIGVPRCGYALGLYRVSLQAHRNWGNGSVVPDTLNRETLRTALANAKVLILASHGGEGYATTWYSREVLRIGPPMTSIPGQNGGRWLCVSTLDKRNHWTLPEVIPVGDRLKMAYVFACDAGAKSEQWKKHLSPAQVITYNRPSTVFDHALWFAVTGPARLANRQ